MKIEKLIKTIFTFIIIYYLIMVGTVIILCPSVIAQVIVIMTILILIPSISAIIKIYKSEKK